MLLNGCGYIEWLQLAAFYSLGTRSPETVNTVCIAVHLHCMCLSGIMERGLQHWYLHAHGHYFFTIIA